MSAVVSSGLRLSFKSHNFNGKWHIQFLLFLLYLFHNFEFGKLENRHRRTKSNSHVQVHCPLASKMSNTEYTPIDITVHVMLMMVNVNADRKTELGLHGAGCGYVWLIAWINVFPSRGKSFWNSISVYSSFSVTLRYGTCQSEAHRHTHSDSSKAKKNIYKSEHQHRHWPYVRTAVAAHRTHAHTLSHQIYYNIFAVDKSCIHAREREKNVTKYFPRKSDIPPISIYPFRHNERTWYNADSRPRYALPFPCRRPHDANRTPQMRIPDSIFSTHGNRFSFAFHWTHSALTHSFDVARWQHELNQTERKVLRTRTYCERHSRVHLQTAQRWLLPSHASRFSCIATFLKCGHYCSVVVRESTLTSKTVLPFGAASTKLIQILLGGLSCQSSTARPAPEPTNIFRYSIFTWTPCHPSRSECEQRKLTN